MQEVEAVEESMRCGDAFVEALIENFVRVDMNDVDTAEALNIIKENPGNTWKEIGVMFGWSMNHT